MKATLEFNLPEEDDLFQRAVEAGKMHSAIWEYAAWLRGICKHGEPEKFDATACREKLFEFLNDEGIEL